MSSVDDLRRGAWSNLLTGATGIALVVAGAALVGIASMGRDGARPGPVLALLAAVAVAGAAGAGLARLAPWLPLLLVVAATTAATVPFWPDAGDPLADPLGYGNANGTLFALGVLAAVGLAATEAPPPARAAAGGCLAVLAAAVGASESVGSVAIVTGALALLVLAWSSPASGVALAAAAVGAAACLTIGMAVVSEGNVDGGALRSRVALWHDALDVALDDPITGVGPGRYADVRRVTDDPDLQWAHHEPLQVAAELGVVGVALLYGSIAWALARAGVTAAPVGPVAVAAVAGLAIHAHADYVLHEGALAVVVAVLVGACRPQMGGPRTT